MKNDKKIKNSAIVVGVLFLIVGFIWFFYFKNKKNDSISNFLTICKVECGKISPCEGKTVSIAGYLDLNNISDEKFLIQDIIGKLPKANLEVDISGDKNNKENIVKKINDLARNAEKPIVITGTVAGFDMPTNGNCQRGFRLNLSKENDLK